MSTIFFGNRPIFHLDKVKFNENSILKMYLVSTVQCVFLVQIDKAIFFHSAFPHFISQTLQTKPVSLSSFSAWESWSKKGRTWERCLGVTGPILGPLPSLPDWEINEVAARPGPMLNRRPRQLSLFSEFPFVHLWKPSNSTAMGVGQVHGDVYCQQVSHSNSYMNEYLWFL